jgi:PAS domain S-box-containing protein
VIGVAVDVTERVRLEEALQESEIRFRTIFEGAAVGVALADMEGRLIEANPALQKFLRYSEEELLGMTFTQVTHPEDVATDVRLYRELKADQRRHYQIEKRYIRKDGEVVWGHLTVSLVRGAEGQPRFAVGMVEDITDRKEMEAVLVDTQRKLAQSQEEERLRIARELHDGAVQQLLGITYELARQQQTLSNSVNGLSSEAIRQEVLQVVTQLRGLISELRPAGLEEFGLTTALEGYVAGLMRHWGPEMPAVDLDLDECGTSLPPSVALALFRAAQEALRNALKHAQAQHIAMRLRLLADEVVLSVRDDGCGFCVPGNLNEFAQHNHFGLIGIAEHVALVGGQLNICSEPGAGTEVTARVPLCSRLDQTLKGNRIEGKDDPSTAC